MSGFVVETEVETKSNESSKQSKKQKPFTHWKIVALLALIPIAVELLDSAISHHVPYNDIGDYIQTIVEMYLIVGASYYIFTKSDKEKALKKELKLERDKLHSALDAMNAGMTIRDKDYKLTYQNDLVLGMFGDLTGQKCYKVFAGLDELCEGCPVEKTFEDGGSHVLEKRAENSEGEVTYWENTSYPIKDEKGEIVACLEVNKNITEKKKLEESIKNGNG